MSLTMWFYRKRASSLLHYDRITGTTLYKNNVFQNLSVVFPFHKKKTCIVQKKYNTGFGMEKSFVNIFLKKGSGRCPKYRFIPVTSKRDSTYSISIFPVALRSVRGLTLSKNLEAFAVYPQQELNAVIKFVVWNSYFIIHVFINDAREAHTKKKLCLTYNNHT